MWERGDGKGAIRRTIGFELGIHLKKKRKVQGAVVAFKQIVSVGVFIKSETRNTVTCKLFSFLLIQKRRHRGGLNQVLRIKNDLSKVEFFFFFPSQKNRRSNAEAKN